MAEIKITTEELIAELERLGIADRHDIEGLTTDEWSAQWGTDPTKTRKILKKAINAGLAYRSGTKYISAINGVPHATASYQIKLPGKTRKSTKRKK